MITTTGDDPARAGMCFGTETLAIVTAAAAVAGAGATAYAASREPPKPKPAPNPLDATQAGLAGARADALEQIQRRSLLSTVKTGEAGLGSPGDVQRKSLLGS